MASLKKNISYQMLYQVVSTITPLITSPYISRVLGADNLGVYSYTQAIVSYFTMAALLGVANYGTRSIAYVKNNPIERRRKFWEIYGMQVISSTTALFMYAAFLLISNQPNPTIAFAQIFWIVACMADVSWYFFGIEDFALTVKRNLVIKLLTVSSIFLFVRQPEDLLLYTLIMSFGTFSSQVVLLVVLLKREKFIPITIKDISKHVIPNLILFIPLSAMTIYQYMDKTMLGTLSSFEQTGYYYNADKVINIPLCVITGIGTVMMPKMTTLQSEKEAFKKLFKSSIEVFMWLAIGMASGIFAVSNEFVPFFFGAGYDQCVILIQCLAVIIIPKTLSNVIRTQYLIPKERNTVFITSVFTGAAVNLVGNYIFIKILKMNALGAVFATLLSEIIVCLGQILPIKKEIEVFQYLLSASKCIPNGIVTIIVVKAIRLIHIPIVAKLIIEIVAGGIAYIICSIIVKYAVNKIKLMITKY